MTILCPQCGASYNPELFTFGIRFKCTCGKLVDDTHRVSANLQDKRRGGIVLYVHTKESPDEETTEQLKVVARSALLEEESNVREMRAMADRISFMITATDYSKIDIELEKRKARTRCEELFPDRVYLFDMIYGSRFRRLWEQFRANTKTS
ncbi:MAG: hypothetical protein GF355_14575 [Candidatus Eisenbacteria bacterium]|nr:hypothetical protein [Candidatus Eisenbacteria bacterium]